MLLLLLPQMVWKLKDYFTIRQGITIGDSEGKFRYKVINMSNISGDLTDVEAFNEYLTEKQIKVDKILTERDYLISCKGIVKGISMTTLMEELKELEKNEISLVASNHFFILTPKDVLPISITKEELVFLHNLIQFFIPQIDERASGRTSTKYLTLRDVEEFEFRFDPVDYHRIAEFYPLHTKYLSLLNDLKKTKEEIKKFNDSLFIKSDLKSDFYPMKASKHNRTLTHEPEQTSNADEKNKNEVERKKLSELTRKLKESEFSFLPKGEISLKEIYEETQKMYPELTNDAYTCNDNCGTGTMSGEYQHRIRTAIQTSKNVFDKGPRGFWIKK